MEGKSKAEYRSSIRSKELIRSAYYELLQSKDECKITVTDIIKTAKINRGTFYAHYCDINDLKRTVENEFVCELRLALDKLNNFENVSSPIDAFKEITSFLKKDEQLYKNLVLMERSDSLIHTLQNVFIEYMESNHCISKAVRESPEFKLRAKFFVSGVTNVYISYFKQELPLSLDEIAESLSEIIAKNSLIF